ncbi:putative tetratricopeptide-like helical domain-containing protein [Rosa chinensis]|uniref:Putative tetratricopeptide-like helical domain-containing protein n=1 Tax=Rosa chinensis TaxID=74649 RepID=A0A2P6Q5L0_ROSCH|nr:uncharacterized protein LOC112202165 [Rosa chinensis]PRQ29463.1 putative tetratricopeptide-like helical domain-containing protein [Rosa chinensis]
MDSALRLHRSALRIPSTTSRAAGLARPYSSFRPSSLSLFSKASTYRTLSRDTFSCPVICALNKPSPPSPNYYKDNGKKIVIVVGGASVVLACVLGVINNNFNFSPTAMAGSRDSSKQESAVGPVVNRPSDVLDSLLKVNRHIATSKSTWRIRTPQLYVPPEPKDYNPDNLKITVAELIKSGKCDVAETQLRSLCRTGGEVGNDVEMNLVLVLIFQGKYEEALERGCLSGGPMVESDGRVHFYKAIIYTMLGRDDEAKTSWNRFLESYSNPLSQLDYSEVVTPKSRRPPR